MTTVQLNLYIFTYNINNKDFDVISCKEDRLEVPHINFENNTLTLRQQLDSLFENISIEYKPVYRLLNNIYIDSLFHCVYFCVIPNYIPIKDTVFKIPVQKYGIHSPNIQQILQTIR